MGRSFGNTAREGPREGVEPSEGRAEWRREKGVGHVGLGHSFPGSLPRLHWPMLSYLNQDKRVVDVGYGGEE